ncbi:hypothetical protein ADK67_12815 [Saccharothrix sp. NRRL B-16348]|uniref:hypothetical protein n=1 Tax=Saccharothrix sp. NRRL B-16348 TaxID=1415542 RepID=UPI0006B05C3A|nr:hypothetical protein [Saccharothrix sp. NRRL B-16348]KOX27977.1 hypothetical protein ADK67_12815 [Saccharothrix sp. NRRL B-16348]
MELVDSRLLRSRRLGRETDRPGPWHDPAAGRVNLAFDGIATAPSSRSASSAGPRPPRVPVDSPVSAAIVFASAVTRHFVGRLCGGPPAHA